MDNKEEYDLGKLIHLILKRKYILVTVTLVSVIISAIITFFIMKPVYQSQTTLIVDKKNATSSSQNLQYNDVMMYQTLTKTYATIGASDDVYSKASQKLNNVIAADKLVKRITITPQTGTQIITVSAKGDSPEEALNIVTAVSASFIEVSNSVFPSGDIRIVNNGKASQAPISPKKAQNLAIGFGVGLILSIGLILIMDYNNNTFENIDDIKAFTDIPVLGVIQLEEE